MTPKLPKAFLQIPLAHRALHDVTDHRPENSRAAIRAAISAGYGIEIDIQATSDSVAMVFHDREMARLAHAQGRISDYAHHDLKGVTLRGGDENIPTLAETLSLVAGQVPLLIEIKDQDGALGPNVGALEENVARELVGYEGPVAVMSFNPYSTKHMRRLCPNIPRGLVTENFDPTSGFLSADRCDHLNDIKDFETFGCSFVSHDHTDLARPRVRQLKSEGANILCWTVKSAEQEQQARKIADNITFEQFLPSIPA